MSNEKPSVGRLLPLVAAAAAIAILAAIVLILWRPGKRPPAPAGGGVALETGAGSEKKLVLMVPTSHVRAGENQAKWFQEETGTVVQVKVVNYDQLQATIAREHASGAPQVDVFYTYYAGLADVVEQGAAMDLTDYIEQNKEVIRPDDFVPVMYDACSLYKGRRWALPVDGDTHVLFYRKSLFDKHGLTPPRTWDDFLAVERTITEKESKNGIYGAAIMASPVPSLLISSFMNRLVAYGGDLLDSEGRPTLDSPEAITALSTMIEHSKYALPTPLETDFDVSRQAFLMGRVAMVEQWTDIGIMAEDPTQSTIQGDWGVVQLPLGTGPKARGGAAMNASFSIGVMSTTRDPDLARSFVRFATRPDILLRLNLLSTGLDPARISTLDSPEYKRFAPAVSAAKKASYERIIPWPVRPNSARLFASLMQHVSRALKGTASAKDALAAAQAEWAQILAPKAP
jgi:multiple sugar transport system substrate-binding protein